MQDAGNRAGRVRDDGSGTALATGLERRFRGTTAVVPTAGFHEEAATPRGRAPPRLVVNAAGFIRCARACLSISVAVQLTRRIRRTENPPDAPETAIGVTSRRRRREFCGSDECDVECAADRLRETRARGVSSAFPARFRKIV